MNSEAFLNFVNSVDDLLNWLTASINVLASSSPISSDLPQLQQQFKDHEDFVLTLSQRQDKVGIVLQRGNHLLTESHLTSEEDDAIQGQVNVINSEWESLRVRTLARQTELQAELNSRQQMFLATVMQKLNSIENKIKSGIIDSLFQEIKDQIADLSPSIKTLNGFIFLLDDSISEEDIKKTKEEYEVSLSKWQAVSDWSKDFEANRKTGKTNSVGWLDWKMEKMDAWLRKTEEMLEENEKEHSNSPTLSALNQNRCARDLKSEIEEMAPFYDQLRNDIYTGDSTDEEIYQISIKFQNYADRWDVIKKKIESDINDVSPRQDVPISSPISHRTPEGNDPRGVIFKNIGLDSRLKLSHGPRNEWANVRIAASTSVGKRVKNIKRTMSDVGGDDDCCEDVMQEKIDFESDASELLDHLEGSLIGMGMITELRQDLLLSIDEQFVLLHDTENDMKLWTIQLEKLNINGEILKKKLIKKNESHWDVDELLRRCTTKLQDVRDAISNKKNKVEEKFEASKFEEELSALRQVVEVYETWINNEIQVGDNFVELSRQLEQNRVKQKAFLMHKSHWQNLNVIAGKYGCEKIENLQQLNLSWQEANSKLAERQKLLSTALQLTPPKSLLDALQEILLWMEANEEASKGITFRYCPVDEMKELLRLNQNLQAEMHAQSSGVQYINNTIQKIIRKTSTSSSTSSIASSSLTSSLSSKSSTQPQVTPNILPLDNQVLDEKFEQGLDASVPVVEARPHTFVEIADSIRTAVNPNVETGSTNDPNRLRLGRSSSSSTVCIENDDQGGNDLSEKSSSSRGTSTISAGSDTDATIKPEDFQNWDVFLPPEFSSDSRTPELGLDRREDEGRTTMRGNRKESPSNLSSTKNEQPTQIVVETPPPPHPLASNDLKGTSLTSIRSSATSTEKLKIDLKEMNERWGKLKQSVSLAVMKFQDAIPLVLQHQSQVKDLILWMDEAELMMKNEHIKTSLDEATLKLQLIECQNLANDSNTMESIKSLVEHSYEKFHLENSNSDFRENACKEKDKIDDRWGCLQSLLNLRISELEYNLKTRQLLNELQTWIDSKEKSINSMKLEVENYDELTEFRDLYKKLFEEAKNTREKILQPIHDLIYQNVHDVIKIFDNKNENEMKKEKSTDCDSALLPLLCVHG